MRRAHLTLTCMGERNRHHGHLHEHLPSFSAPVRPRHVDGLDPGVLGVGEVVHAEDVEVADPHPGYLRRKGNVMKIP